MSNNEPANEAAPSQPDHGAPSGASPAQPEPFGAHIQRESELETAREAQAETKRPSAHPLAPDPVTPIVEAAASSSVPPAAEISIAAKAEQLAHELASSPLFSEVPPSAPPAPPAPTFVHAATPPPAPPPRPVVEEVTAVRVSRFEAPAPTIDVTAQRATPPPAREPSPAQAPRAAEPVAAAAGSSTPPGTSGPTPPPQAAPSPSAPPTESSGRFWSAACHLMMIPATLTIFLGGVITFFLWQIAGREDSLAEDQGREALNFQINVAVLSALLAFSCFGSPLLFVLVPASWVICIIAAIRAGKGERYRYPMIWRVVSH